MSDAFGEVILGDQPLTPVEVEKQIREVTVRIERGTEIVRTRMLAFKESERLLKREKASRYLEHRDNGLSIKDADARTVIDTDPARAERDLADVTYQNARDWLRAYENKLRGLQTQAAGLRVAYPMAGRGVS